MPHQSELRTTCCRGPKPSIYKDMPMTANVVGCTYMNGSRRSGKVYIEISKPLSFKDSKVINTRAPRSDIELVRVATLTQTLT